MQYDVGGMTQGNFGFPGGIRDQIALPFDQILAAMLASLMVQYRINLVLLFTVDDVRQWSVIVSSHWMKVSVEYSQSQQRHVKYRVNSPTRWKHQAIGTGIVPILGNRSENLEGAESP
jgi:hypothetical protein